MATDMLPSSMSLLGLVRHLTEVERNWFARALAGDPPLYSSGTSPDWAFDEVAAADAAADLARYEDEVRRSRRVAAALHDLDAAGSGIRDGRPVSVSLRWIYLHMIEEYARHNGHADYLRERIDGVTGV
jgi:uncharacterized damage-inducible protein DinB